MGVNQSVMRVQSLCKCLAFTSSHPKLDVAEATHATPHDGIPRQWIARSCKIQNEDLAVEVAAVEQPVDVFQTAHSVRLGPQVFTKPRYFGRISRI